MTRRLSGTQIDVQAMNARLALAADLPAIEVALASAFLDDPMTSWVVGEPDPARRLELTATGFFRPALHAGLRRGHTYTVPGPHGSAGAAIWSPPDIAMLDDSEAAAFGTALREHAGDEALGRIITLGELVDARHPHDRPQRRLLPAPRVRRAVGRLPRHRRPDHSRHVA